MKNHFLSALLIASSLIISCDEDDTETIVTPETENVVPVEEETPKEEITEEGITEEVVTETSDETIPSTTGPLETFIRAGIEANVITEEIDANAPGAFRMFSGGFSPKLATLIMIFSESIDPNGETVSYSVNLNGVTIAENISFPELTSTSVESESDVLVRGEALGEDNFFTLSRTNTGRPVIEINSAASPFEMNPKDENIAVITANNTSGLSRPAPNRFRF